MSLDKAFSWSAHVLEESIVKVNIKVSAPCKIASEPDPGPAANSKRTRTADPAEGKVKINFCKFVENEDYL